VTSTPGDAIDQGGGPLLLTVALVLVLGMVVIAILCFCRARVLAKAQTVPVSLASRAHPEGFDSVADLIPPLFYTEGLRDPLKQEDLHDRVISERPIDGVGLRSRGNAEQALRGHGVEAVSQRSLG
jgi:hypothetical protein